MFKIKMWAHCDTINREPLTHAFRLAELTH